MQSRSLGMPSRNDRPPSIWNTHGLSGNVFVNPAASISRVQSVDVRYVGTHIAACNEWTPNTKNTALDPRCQSGLSARNSLDPEEWRFSKDYGADQQRLQISDLHCDKFPKPATFACWKMRSTTEVCICSQFLTEAMLWIKEVEMVESVDHLKFSRSIRGTRIASALNKIIQNTRFKKEGQSGGTKRGPLSPRRKDSVTWSTSTSRSLEPTILSRIMPTLFTVVLRKDDIQEFDSKWDGFLSSLTQITSDDILERLYKWRRRESEKLKTVLELYNMEIHQKKAGPDYHRLKTMVKRCIEQDSRNMNFGSRNGNFEKNAVVNNQGTKQRVRRILGDCWQWETQRAVCERRQLQFPPRYNKRGKSSPSNPSPNSFMQQGERKPSRTRSPRGRSPSGRMSRWPCKDYLRRNLQ